MKMQFAFFFYCGPTGFLNSCRNYEICWIKLRRLLESRLQILERMIILKINGDIFFFL